VGRQQFISELSPLNNPDHVHLQMADIGFVWTNVENTKRGGTSSGNAS
jgi:hypothetical protein